ncbi:hypothetical protein ACFX2I_024866 [Malus domestica]
MEPKLSILPLRTVVAAVANTGEVTAIYRTFCLSEYFLSFQWLEALQGSSSCDSGRWGCGEDLYAYLLYQQQVSHSLFIFLALCFGFSFPIGKK